MKIASLVGCFAFLAATCGLSRQSMGQGAPAEGFPIARSTVQLKNYPATSGLVEIGTRTNDAIRVIVYGEIERPGIYYLSPSTTVGAAVESAGGLTMFAAWNVSCVLRPIDAEQAERIKFTRKTRTADLETPLKEGDRLYLNAIFD